MVSQSRNNRWELIHAIRTPEAVRALAILPQLDGAVFAAGRVELAVGREADAPDWAMVTFVYIWKC